MKGDFSVNLFVGFLLLILFFLVNRSKKRPRKQESEIEVVSQKPLLKKSVVEKVVPKFADMEKAPVYAVEKKKKTAILQKGWTRKTSIKQAFIFSEIFRKVNF